MLIGQRCKGKRSQHISRAKTALVRAGWLRFEGVSKSSATGTWQGGRYAVISHEEWAKRKSFLLGRSPCQPEPETVSVAAIHPGGMSYRKRNLQSTEGHTASGVQNLPPGKNRVCFEGHTDLQHGRTHGLCPSKDTQSVDFESSGDIQTVDATAVMPPVAIRLAAIADEPKVNPPGQEKPEPSEGDPESDRMQDSYESWLAEARDKVGLASFNLHFAAYRSFMGKAGRTAKDFAPPHLTAAASGN